MSGFEDASATVRVSFVLADLASALTSSTKPSFVPMSAILLYQNEKE